jgi:large subunit ribosomal protein L15e
MGAYKYITQTLQKQYKERDAAYRGKVMKWRAAPAIERVEYPTNLARARTLGYQAKQGYIVVRVRVDKGRRTRRKTMGGRKHKNNYRFVQPQLSHQAIGEQRVNRLFRNMEVLNSYWVGEDGNYKFFEVILADPAKPSVNISSAIRGGKAFRGLTSAGNSRGPSKKKGENKKLRRKKLQATPYHFKPYVKSVKAAVAPRPAPKRAEKKEAAPKPVGRGHEQHAAAPAQHAAHEHAAHANNPAHPQHGAPAHEAKHEAKHEAAHSAHPEHKPHEHKK